MEIRRKERRVAASNKYHEVSKVVASALDLVLCEGVELTPTLLEHLLSRVEVKAEDISIGFDLVKGTCTSLKDVFFDVINLCE